MVNRRQIEEVEPVLPSGHQKHNPILHPVSRNTCKAWKVSCGAHACLQCRYIYLIFKIEFLDIYLVYVIYKTKRYMGIYSPHQQKYFFTSPLTIWLRQWQYNTDVPEYFVILEDQAALKKAELLKEQEETALGDTWENTLWSQKELNHKCV